MKNALWKGIGAVLTAWSSMVFAADEIKLQDVRSIVTRANGQSSQTAAFEAIVKNIAFNKQVFAHYRAANGNWVDLPLSFNRPAGTDREVWSAELNNENAPPFDIRFALRYVVNGQTYWDNNNGADYVIAQDAGVLLGAGVNVDHLFFTPTRIIGRDEKTLFGAVSLRNIALMKDVNVKYTTDNWATTRSVKASYSPTFWSSTGSSASNPNQYGVEVWTFELDIGAASEVEYAIEYRVAGQTFWDNNLGRNYRSVLVRQ